MEVVGAPSTAEFPLGPGFLPRTVTRSPTETFEFSAASTFPSSALSGRPTLMNRSNKGCWTCRLRHRKCDEAVPACAECRDRHIHCHGYGPKPAWMADKARLRAELLRIKHAVKENFRRTKRLQNAHPPGAPASDQNANRLHSPSTPPAHDPENAPSSTPLHLLDASAVQSSSSLSNGMAFRDMQLLMHYLDHIYALQFPYYEDDARIGGRGWLFWLLMQNGPLYQAALSLAALHQHTQLGHRSGSTTESELIEYHTRALQGLQRVLLREGRQAEGFAREPEQLVEFLACGTFLISFEVFQGGVSSDWQLHLDALVSVVSNMEPSSLTVTSSSAGVDVARRFLVMNALWFELLASASTGAAPRIPYREWLAVEGIDIAAIMGCQGWAMVAIGDIAKMDAQEAAPDPGRLMKIKKRLEEGIDALDAQEREEADQVSNNPCDATIRLHAYPSRPSTSSSTPTSRCITRVYATAALVNLHTISANTAHASISSPSSPSTLHAAVSRTMAALQQMPPTLSKRSLVWPICIAGCMAAPDQQPFFESMVAGMLEGGGRGFGNCETVLHVVRKAWACEGSQTAQKCVEKVGGCAWRRAMSEMRICALLV